MNRFPVIVLAGGIATRLRPITEEIPKALVNVGGQPFIFQQLRLLHSHGIRHVVISAWYRGEMIRDSVGSGDRFGMKVEYVFDGDQPLGTGGAVRHAIGLLNGPFFVLYGDSYLPCDYSAIQDFFMAAHQPGLMTVYRNQNQWDRSNVEIVENGIVAYDKKMSTAGMEYIDYGLGVFKPEVFAHLPDGQPTDLSDIYQQLVTAHSLLAYPVRQRFYEIGSFKGLRELDKLLTADPDRFLERKSNGLH
jgi:N-acetyl-alpha-D-muramate 1-phosphate uridylyltransferase